MSTRNPMNDRYTTDEARTGTSRKSAASAKPKAKAANTVTVVDGKNPKDKKAAAKQRKRAEQEKQRQQEAKYYSPNTPRYKTLRRLWWIGLIGAIVATILSWIFQSRGYATATVVTMVFAYVFIIAALIIDLGPTRKERKRYAEALNDKNSPEYAAYKETEKAQKELEKARKAEAKAAYDANKAQEPEQVGLPGLIAKLKARFSGAKETAQAAQAEAEAAAEKADK